MLRTGAVDSRESICRDVWAARGQAEELVLENTYIIWRLWVVLRGHMPPLSEAIAVRDGEL